MLFLIATFFSAAGLFVLLGAEFLAMILIVVYVGAVAVLFLFVVMLLDVDDWGDLAMTSDPAFPLRDPAHARWRRLATRDSSMRHDRT